MESNLKINEKCNQCGGCLGCGFDFLNSDEKGNIVVKSGTIIREDSNEFKTLQEICPVGAFQIENNVDKESLYKSLLCQLKNFKGLKIPTEQDLNFNKDEYKISIPLASGEVKYEYSSDSAAERAALREFERIMYSQIDNIILKIITEYRIKYVKPYYTKDINEGSVYAKHNQKLIKILEGIKQIAGDQLPNDFLAVDIYPDKNSTIDTIWKMLNKGEMISQELVSTVKDEFDYPSSQYDCYWTTRDMEVTVGTDWRGNLKTKDRYCYMNIYEACVELGKDILNACEWAKDDIEERAVGIVEALVEEYNKELKQSIQSKLEQINSASVQLK
ncbi:MAG: hypothetical protein MR324_01265 [Lachnospiraceae bacterium]|nr:hypothetical protein [Lachnospiraceae bacterium]